MQLEKVISGGQTGADIAGVDAALACGLKTGGWMPKGWLTLEGPRPEYREKYGMMECNSTSYPVRTSLNVRDSSITLIVGFDLDSRGTKQAIEAAGRFSKRWLSVDLNTQRDSFAGVARWISFNECQVLNVAGNRETKPPTVYQPVYEFLVDVFKRLQRRF